MSVLITSYQFIHGPGHVPDRVIKFKRKGGAVHAKVYRLKNNTELQRYSEENILVEMMNTSKKIEMLKTKKKSFIPNKRLSDFSPLIQNSILGELEPMGSRRIHVGDVYITIFDTS